MSVVTPKASGSRLPQDTPLPLKPEKRPKRNREKKEKAKNGSENHAAGPAAEAESKRGPAAEEVDAGEVEWAWTSLTDSGASHIPPFFTRDGSYFFSVVGSSVKIHSATTGQVVSTLSSAPSRDGSGDSQSHRGLITGAAINPQNSFQLITTSLDGTIKIWDFLDALLLQIIDLKQTIFQMCVHEKFKGYVFVSAARPTKRKNKSGVEIEDNVAVLRVSLQPTDATAQAKVTTSAEIIAFGKTRFIRGLGVSASGDWLVGIGGHKSYVAQTNSPKAGFTKFVSPERLMCLAFHPSEDYFATGDDKGNIRSWYCLREELMAKSVGTEKRAQTTTLHWHAHAVSSLAFTPNGAYLLSGGEESVLVIWQLHTGKKEFIPRVGAPITTVAVLKIAEREEEYVLGLADASHVFVSSATMKISRAFSRIKLDPVTPQLASHNHQTPLAVHARSSTIIIPSSHPSTLQTYSPSYSKVVLELEVSPSNRVSRREDTPIEPSRVESCVISPQGDWMVTLDTREGDDTVRGESCLKLWWWDWKAGFWILNSRIDRPHGLKRVTSLSFNPIAKDNASLLLVTTGEDGYVKTWRIRSMKTKTGDADDFWVTRSTFTFRSELPHHASWSSDGSLLSITFGTSTVLYDPINNAVRATLPVAEGVGAKSSYFIGRNARYLLVVGVLDLILWDLLTQNVCWQTHLVHPVHEVLPHPSEEAFTVLVHPPTASNKPTTQVLVFGPSSCRPARKRTLPFQARAIAWYSSSAVTASASFSLVAITHAWGVVLLGDEVHAPEDEGAAAKGIGSITNNSAGPSRTLFQDIFGHSAFTEPANDRSRTSTESPPSITNPGEGSSSAQLFDTPAYLLPPLETLFDTVMESFLKERTSGEVDAPLDVVDNAGEDEDEMDVEESPLVVGRRNDRLVDRREMGMFIELFRQHAVKAPSSGPAPQPALRLNGAPSKPKANGVHRAEGMPTSPAPALNGVAPRTKGIVPQTEMDAVPLSPAPGGKKRKKSLGT